MLGWATRVGGIVVSTGLGYVRSNALGALALFVALGGTGYAATAGFTPGPAKIKACAGSNGTLKLLTGKKCKKGQKAVAWNQQGVAGPKGASGTPGAAGAAGGAGTAGANGTARAYGVIKANGELVAPKSKGLTAAALPPPATKGSYCVTPTAGSGIDPEAVEPSATPDYGEGMGEHHIVQSVEAATGDKFECSGGWVFITENYNSATKAWDRQDNSFAILVP
jgi:hypothetical protein